jgi:hypothetical protein
MFSLIPGRHHDQALIIARRIGRRASFKPGCKSRRPRRDANGILDRVELEPRIPSPFTTAEIMTRSLGAVAGPFPEHPARRVRSFSRHFITIQSRSFLILEQLEPFFGPQLLLRFPKRGRHRESSSRRRNAA